MAQSPDEVGVVVAELASDVLETPIEELPPLVNAINPDALNDIAVSDSSQEITVTFVYAGLRVYVHAGNNIYVESNHDRSTVQL